MLSRFSFRSKPLLFSIAALIVIVFLFYTPLPSSCDAYSDTVVCQVADKARNHFPYKSHAQVKYQDLAHVKSKYAFATFLSGKEDATIDDPYFIGVRILTYQLLHASDTRSSDPAIPFVVLCTDKVPEAQRERLRKDGAIVIIGESIKSDWAKTSVSTWEGIMTKLRLWELTQFERIALLDGDTVLTHPLDGIFSDPAVQLQETLFNKTGDAIKPDEATLPSTYSFAGVPEMKKEHHYPPTEEQHDFPNINYLNGGFFVFKPSLEMLNYYLSVLKIPGRFNPELQEQNLLNYAHRREGSMSWTQLANTWNIHFANFDDLEGGVKSLHEKWWTPQDERLTKYMLAWRWRMDGFFESQDALSKE
ncbi:nucleotide-diphospho-sugar transferase [Byssothecium circinans]|uniref:Nucleotide-diphospho-sugar transferase n=1 Tax=Byssothecium circinans TaxID=147558 RepID=A0A6A5TB41_9PLEO|nr:nucleotide-diphospho-sugar transferase [Byssothecium circinans]